MPNPTRPFRVGDRVRRIAVPTQFSREGFMAPGYTERAVGTVIAADRFLHVDWPPGAHTATSSIVPSEFELVDETTTTTAPTTPLPVGARVQLSERGRNYYGDEGLTGTVQSVSGAVRRVVWEGQALSRAYSLQYIEAATPEPVWDGDHPMALGPDDLYKISVQRDADTDWKLKIMVNLAPVVTTVVRANHELPAPVQASVKRLSGTTGQGDFGFHLMRTLHRKETVISEVLGEPEVLAIEKALVAAVDGLLAGVTPVRVLLTGTYAQEGTNAR